MGEKSHDMRCPVCLSEWNQSDLMSAGIKTCPHCKTIIQPLKIEHDGYIFINWQDLRVLAIYSKRWASMFDMTQKGNQDAVQALENILEGIRRYQPTGTPQLTPPLDTVILHGAPKLEEENILEWKRDATGKIISPFFKRLF